MPQRTITTRIAIDGEAEFKKQLGSVNRELGNLKSEMAVVTDEFRGQANSAEALTEKGKVLQKMHEQQAEKVRALEQAVADSTEVLGEANQRTDYYRQQLNRAKVELSRLNREVEDNARYLDEARRSTDNTADSIDEFGRAAREAESDMGTLDEILGGSLGTLSKIKGVLVGGAVAGAIKELGSAILEVEESTREYRSIMASLEVSSKSAGYTAQETSEAYDYLYRILGDSQTTATTLANLQALGVQQSTLMRFIDATTGAWSRYGDSIPIDGLAESINETAKAGQITGTFADVLNWAGISEDAFNETLAATESASVRTQLILEVMTREDLPQAGQAWQELNADVTDANDAQNRMEQAMGHLGEVLAPVATELRNFAANAIDKLADSISKAIDWISSMREEIKKLGQETEHANWSQYGVQDIDFSNAGFNGSHAMGLRRVPFDGYAALLHRGEAVLTAGEAETWRLLTERPALAPSGVTRADLQQTMAAAVNGMATLQQGSTLPEEVSLTLRSDDGQTLGRWLVPYVRGENKSNPEVVSDKP